jgi:superfamily I DNA/RNA helicase
VRQIYYGPPGTGKTTTLIGLVEQALADGALPERIVYISFTRKAVSEALDRAVAKFDLPRNSFQWFRTLHSLCMRILHIQPGSIIGTGKLNQFAMEHDYSMRASTAGLGDQYGRMVTEDDRAFLIIEKARSLCAPLDTTWTPDSGIALSHVLSMATVYSTWKHRNEYYDFHDLIELFVQKGEPPDIDLCIIDEAQDLTPLQWRAADKLETVALQSVYAADDDQALYTFNAADATRLLHVEADRHVLGQSYRVPALVHQLADTIIGRITGERQTKVWKSRADIGSVVYLQSLDSLPGAIRACPNGSWLLLARHRHHLPRLIQACLEAPAAFECDIKGIENNLSPETVRLLDIIKVIRTWMLLQAGKAASRKSIASLLQHLGLSLLDLSVEGQSLVTGPGRVSAGKLTHVLGLDFSTPWDKALVGLTRRDIDYAQQVELGGTPRVRISTIHGAKGGEADYVAVLPTLSRTTREGMSESENALDNEHRVMYVAVTRARQRVYLIEGPGYTWPTIDELVGHQVQRDPRWMVAAAQDAIWA